MLRLTVALLLGVIVRQTFADEPEAIIGGTSALPLEFPYQCSMNLNGSHICGCSIINRTKILTAAHCVKSISAPYNNLRIHAGSIDNLEGNAYAVKNIKAHPDYQAGAINSWKNDIAVITLSNPINYSINERPIVLASKPPEAGTLCVFSGWGRTSMGGDIPQFLQKMHTTLMRNDDCTSALNMPIYQSHICAFAIRGIGACSGDSGGPLVCNGELYGITSFVVPCAKGFPDVYTSVYHYHDFIQQEMEN